jgi:hypothetical protein
MAKPPKFRLDGEPDGRGHAEGSKRTQFAEKDGRVRPGRTPGSLSLAKFYRDAAAAKITVTLPNGAKLRITKAQAIILRQAEKALKGDQRAAERFLEKLEQYSPAEVQPDLTALKLLDDATMIAGARKRGLLDPQDGDEE